MPAAAALRPPGLESQRSCGGQDSKKACRDVSNTARGGRTRNPISTDSNPSTGAHSTSGGDAKPKR